MLPGINKDLFQIKGIRDGLLVSFGEADLKDIRSALLETMDQQPAFFKGARMALDVGAMTLKVAELSKLRDLLSERGVSLWAVVSESNRTQLTAQNLGLATRLAKPKPEPASVAVVGDARAPLWISHTLRSGTRIEHDSHVFILGDVNPGAEVVSGGSVVVWGRLRGMVHAGAQGDDQAVVAALELAPSQLRIASEVAVSPKEQPAAAPEIARLREGRLVAEAWQSGE